MVRDREGGLPAAHDATRPSICSSSHGFSPVFVESPGGHTWINWRNYLVEFAPQLFHEPKLIIKTLLRRPVQHVGEDAVQPRLAGDVIVFRTE